MGTRPYQKRGSFAVRRAFAALLLLCGLAAAQPAAAQAWDQGTDTDDAQARAIVVTRNSFFKVDDLNFGDIVAGTTASVIRITPAGVRSRPSGNATLVGTGHRVARFAGQGRRNQLVLISITQASIQITGPGAPMTVSQFEIGSTPTAILTVAPVSFTITSTTGVFNFPVGARLNVGANQAGGTYTGQFEINLDYL
jgi:hypothetical protein